MRRWIPLIVCILAVLLALSFTRHCTRPPRPPPVRDAGAQDGGIDARLTTAQVAQLLCPSNTQALPGSGNADAIDCDPDCGQNGFWYNEGFKFRTLYPLPASGDGDPNDYQMRITSFKLNGQDLWMQIDGDRVVGIPKNVPPVDGGAAPGITDLSNAEITIKGPRPGCQSVTQVPKVTAGPPVPDAPDSAGSGIDCRQEETYTLTIHEIGEKPFWAGCRPDAPQDDAQSNSKCTDWGLRPVAPVYTFTVETSSGACTALCQPDMSPSAESIHGNAVVFTGDTYSYTGAGVAVRSVDGNGSSEQPVPPNTKLFNISCSTSATYNLHFLRHTVASMQPAPWHPTVAQRKTMLQVLAADYCGNGHYFTVNHHPLGIEFAGPLQTIASSGIGAAQSIDAMWSGDGSGATCLGVPRLSDQPGKDVNQVLAEIHAACPDRSMPPCDAGSLGPAQDGGLADPGSAPYAISTNAFP